MYVFAQRVVGEKLLHVGQSQMRTLLSRLRTQRARLRKAQRKGVVGAKMIINLKEIETLEHTAS